MRAPVPGQGRGGVGADAPTGGAPGCAPALPVRRGAFAAAAPAHAVAGGRVLRGGRGGGQDVLPGAFTLTFFRRTWKTLDNQPSAVISSSPCFAG